jgi:pimeloyl-ACP methyl ester carboxylesterase
VLITIAIIYGSFCACVFIFQRNLIYFPTKIPADVVESLAKEHGFEPWKNLAGQIIGWKIPAAGEAQGSVLIVHGNAGCALSRDYLAQPIHAMGAPASGLTNDGARLDVFVLEYPGFGARPGSPNKASLVAAAEEAFQLMPPRAPRYVVSESIGTGVACELARNHAAEIKGMALFVPYHNLASVAQRHMPFLPAYFLLRDRFNPEDCLKAYRGPIQFVVAGADEILGPGTGKKLCEGYAGPKILTVIPGAGHNDVAAQAPDWWLAVFKFWQQKK